ncbi:MAG: insulinase family protein [Alphaproteobacteria bacterium]|jgi:zinc protease|nr:insulinase family protein [Alphaproteobacteria bacterium]
MKNINKAKKTSLIRYSIIFIGLIFLAFSLLHNKEDEIENITTNAIEGFIKKVQKPKVKGVDNILLYENTENNIISINITFKGGSALDTEGYDGISNFLANAMIMGAGGYSVSDFSKMFEEYSIKINTQVNRDSITFEITTLNYYKSRAFNLLGLILNSPNLSNNEITLTRDNLIAEYNIKSQQPRYLVGQALRKQLFGNHKYFGDISGNPTTISKITPHILKDFKSKVITKSNMYIAISGNISKNEVETELNKITSNLPNGDKDFLTLEYVEPSFANKVIEISPKGASQSEVLIAFNSPRINTPMYPYARVLNTYMGLMPDSLLFNTLRNEKGLVYTVNSVLYQDSITNYWLVSLGVSLDNSSEAIDSVKQILDDLKNQQYNIKDIIIAKNWMLDNELRYFSNNRNIAAYLNNMQFLGISLNRNAEYAKLYANLSSDKIDQLLKEINTYEITIVKVVKF